MTALRALIPFFGTEECAPFPVKCTFTEQAARPPRPTRFEPPEAVEIKVFPSPVIVTTPAEFMLPLSP